jgi:micrococcal nuclease
MYEYNAKIISVYDGDTVRATIDLGFGVVLNGYDGKGVSLRLYGLNTPEVRGDEKEQGLVSRDRLRERILGKEVLLKTFKDATGKYGRYIAEIYLKDENINEWLITEGLAERKEY